MAIRGQAIVEWQRMRKHASDVLQFSLIRESGGAQLKFEENKKILHSCYREQDRGDQANMEGFLNSIESPDVRDFDQPMNFLQNRDELQ